MTRATVSAGVFELENVSVSFRRNAVEARSLKYSLASWLHGRPRTAHDALSDVSLSVAAGERLGVIGRNGAGKSTLLRVLARVIVPQHGRVNADPTRRIVPLLDLGVGFQPDLSGAENCILAGSLLGVPPARTKARLDHIVRFAELDGFIHEPVKHYSSGMYARLAFALAFDVKPDVLLIDEIFGVGDEFFTEKCLARIHSLVAGGVTSVFVSHDLDFLRAQCNRLVWLDSGRLVMDGDPAIVSGAYRERRGVFDG
jgi:ABC-type polysaccharide/polyol phosphate transport system ATPase subunit